MRPLKINLAIGCRVRLLRAHSVWLTDEELQGYYNGVSNEALWPLCHMAHARPIFRAEDWRQ